METAERWIARDEALARLRVKTQTLYAYVSRGRISARPDPANPRRSLYAAGDIARLTGRTGSPQTTVASRGLVFAHPALRGVALIPSSVSVAANETLYYRGQDAVRLSDTATVEDAARLLWEAGDVNPFAGLGPRLDTAGGGSTRARLFAALARRAVEDPASTGRDAAALKAEAASVLNEVFDAVAGPGPRLHFHQRLGRGWKVLERDSPLIRRALVLAADFDMDAAVVATRAAAGGGASPAGAALAGLATAGASAMAAELTRVIAWVIEARRDPAAALALRIATEGQVPGFGDPAWPSGDPRARALIEAAALPADLAGIAREGELATGECPTFALALALVARRLDLPRDAAADLLLLGRLTGLMAHAMDQASDGSPIAARLRYVGPRPGAH